MTAVRSVGIAALVVVACCASAAAQACDSTCKEVQIEAYFERLSTVYRRGTSGDIDRLFELFAPNVRYVHMEYDARFDRTAWKEAFNANRERGAYRKDDSELIDVTKIIHGRKHSAVAYRYMRRTEDGTLQAADDQGELLALFGFDGGRIVLIEEYW